MDHILVVDDEPLILKTLKNQLELDFFVHTADSGYRALEILKTQPIKVIVSDQRMPNMLGHELLKQAKLIKPNATRVLLTGYSDLQSIINSVNAGEIFRFVSKPWKSETLLSVIKLGIAIYDRLDSVTKLSKNIVPPQPVDQATVVQPAVKPGILFVGYDSAYITQVQISLESKFNIIAAETAFDAFREISTKKVDVMVSELRLNEYNPLEFLGVIKNEYPAVVQIVLTTLLDSDYAVKCINELNVYRYIVKSESFYDLDKILNLAILKHNQYKAVPESNIIQIAKKINPNLVPDYSEKATILDRIKAVQSLLQQNKATRPI